MFRASLLAALYLVAIGLSAPTGSAFAQLRTLPATALGGTLRHLHDRIVEINGDVRELASGAQIRDQFNRILLPTMVPPGSLVRYTVDAQGRVFHVWILTEQEAAQPLPRN